MSLTIYVNYKPRGSYENPKYDLVTIGYNISQNNSFPGHCDGIAGLDDELKKTKHLSLLYDIPYALYYEALIPKPEPSQNTLAKLDFSEYKNIKSIDIRHDETYNPPKSSNSNIFKFPPNIETLCITTSDKKYSSRIMEKINKLRKLNKLVLHNNSIQFMEYISNNNLLVDRLQYIEINIREADFLDDYLGNTLMSYALFCSPKNTKMLNFSGFYHLKNITFKYKMNHGCYDTPAVYNILLVGPNKIDYNNKQIVSVMNNIEIIKQRIKLPYGCSIDLVFIQDNQ